MCQALNSSTVIRMFEHFVNQRQQYRLTLDRRHVYFLSSETYKNNSKT